MTDPRYASLLPGISQYTVDFVVPKVGIDIPLGIDPFLLFKSRDAELASLHVDILGVFNAGLDAIRNGRLDEAERVLDFPEVPEIGLGMSTKKGKRGRGVGTFLTSLIIETLRSSPALLDRGIRHIEEMQLVSVGIGPDRTSDIAANIIKSYLIDYTRRQASVWSLPVTAGVPIAHVYNKAVGIWEDGYYDLPISPIGDQPMLLVPRRIVRALPWINYDDFFRMEFATYLAAKRVRDTNRTRGLGAIRSVTSLAKDQIVSLTQNDVERIDRYIGNKERSSSGAQPSQEYLTRGGDCSEAERLKAELSVLQPGREYAGKYQQTVLQILNFLFNPDLIDGEPEVRTIDGTERRNIVFTNDSDINFWEYVRSEHSGILLMFETKNMAQVEAPALNQTATYLGDRLGRLGFIVTRNAPGDAQVRKAFSIYNDSSPRKIVLFVSDIDLFTMVDMKCQGNDPSSHMQRLYRKFRQTVQ